MFDRRHLRCLSAGAAVRSMCFAAALLAVGAAGVAGAAGAAGGADAPRVVATIKPLHSLVAGVMAGIAEPVLLISGGVSPHDYALRPSDARALDAADVIFWIGPGVETFLVKPLATLTDADGAAGAAGTAKAVAMSALDDIRLLPTRRGGMWPAGTDHGPDTDAHDDDSDETGDLHDMHLWLDPDNGRVMVAAIAAALGRLDPAHADAYAANAARMTRELAALDRALADRLGPVKDIPYVVFHDGFHYFEARYGLAAAGSISTGPDRAPGARRLHQIRRRIIDGGAVCVFTEPQFRPRVVATLIEGTAARVGILDPMGSEIAPGPGAYAALLTALADALAACLAPSARPIQPPPSTRPPS